MVLPLLRPAGGIQTVEHNTFFQQAGIGLVWLPFFLVSFGYQASRGKRGARWFLVVVCAITTFGIVLLANDTDLRTLYPAGPYGVVDHTQPGVVASLGIAFYVAGAGVIAAFIGAVTFFIEQQE